MKKMKKMLGLGKKRREPPEPPPLGHAWAGSRLGLAGGLYKVRSKELPRLHRAAAEGDLVEVRHLLRRHHDPDERDKSDRTPLHFACANGCIDVVTFLVSNQCQLDLYDSDTRTPLMKAVQCQQDLCAIYLLEQGADPDLVDAYSNTALHFAAFNSSISIAKHLLEYNANVEAQNKDGNTPLIVAVTENNREMVEFLLKQGASVHATDNSGRTPLLIATSNKKRDLTNILLFHGSDVSHKDESGWSARDYALLSDDPILLQYIADYSRQRDKEEKSLDEPNILSILSRSGKMKNAAITLGAPATNREVIDDHSSGDSVRVSGQMYDGTWQSSEEEEFSPKKLQKPNLAHLMNVSQQLKKSLDMKSSIMRTEHIESKSDCEAGDDNESLPKPLFQVKSFPQPIRSSPGSFSKCSQMVAHLSSKQEESSEEEEKKEEEGKDSENENEKISDVLIKKLPSNESSQNWSASQDGAIRKVTEITGMNKEEEDRGAESPWDSECTTESPRKPAVSSLPASPAKNGTCMHSITEEPWNSKDIKLETATTILQHATSSHPLNQTESKEKQRSDLMRELGLDDADDIEDASDWDSTSLSLKSVPYAKTYGILTVGEHKSPLQSAKAADVTETPVPSRAECDVLTVVSKGQQCDEQNDNGEVEEDENKVEEEKRKQGLEADGKKEAANIGQKVDVETEQKTEQMPTINENQHIRTAGQKGTEISQVINRISSPDRERFMQISYQRKNHIAKVKEVRKSGNKRPISKQRVAQEITGSLHQLQDDSSSSEASLEDKSHAAKSGNEKKKIHRRIGVTPYFDDLTQSSDTAAEDNVLSVTKEAVMLMEQLKLDNKDSVSILKLQNIFREYERLIQREQRRYTHIREKVKKLENEKKEQERILEEMRDMKSVLNQQQLKWESDISNLKFSLKQENEKRMTAEILYEKIHGQSRKKEEQYCKQMEEKQQLELMLRSSEMELKTLKDHLKQVEEERNAIQQQLCQEQKVRFLQEGSLNSHLRRHKELEEELKKVTTMQLEMSDNQDQEKKLLHKNQILQDELSVLRLELDRIRIQHQEQESKYLEENEALKEKIEELKLNEDALTQTVFQCNGQINISKTEAAMLTTKLEHIKEHKERLEMEINSFHSRLNSTAQELERCQLGKHDAERVLQRERDEWIRLKDKLNHDICTLREASNTMSQQLSKSESKANGLENELHQVTYTLREKSLLLESCQRDLNQAQGQVKELENARQAEKDQMNKYIVKHDSMQERLAQLQSENLLLRQQLEDFQNKSIIKEKVVTDVQDRFNDIFSKLRSDTEKQVQLMEERNKELVTKCDNQREQVLKYEAEKADREGIIRQLQQELADSLKKQSMTEASLEVSTRYRIDLEEDKQQCQKEIERIKSKLQESEEQYFQSEKCIHNLKNALDAKEHEAIVAAQKLKDLLVASSGANNAIKQLEEHVQRLEIENARLEATTNQQANRIEILQKDMHSNASAHNNLEELITGLQTAKINLEEQLSQQVQKQTMLSATAQDTHNLWEEELKSRSKLGLRLSELDREKAELTAQLENERKKVKKIVELKHSVDIRLDQEMKRNSELQKECHGIRKLLKITKKKLKEYDNTESSPQSNFHGDIKKRYSDIDIEVEKLRTKVDELSRNLESESKRCTQLESRNHELHEHLSSMKILHKNYEKLEKSKQQLEEEVANLKHHIQGNAIDYNKMEQYKKDTEERARQDIRQKLEEVNLFLQTQAASQETLEQIRTTNYSSLKNQLENRIRDLESELTKLKNSQQDSGLQKHSIHTELERYKELYSEELKMRKSLRSKLDRSSEKLAEANAKLFYERNRSRSLLANSFLGGSLSTSPVLETVQFGNLGCNLAFTRPLSLEGEFMNPTGSPLASKNRMEAYLEKMQMELEKNIAKELDQANAELDTGSLRASPIGSVGGSSKNLNADQDQVSKATQQYLDVLKKNYMI